MKTFITKNVLISVFLIFTGLSVSANRYQFDAYQTLSPSHQTAVDAGIFSSGGNMYSSSPKRGFEGGDEDPFGGGDATDPTGDGYNDDGDSRGGGFGDDDDDPLDPGGGTDPDCAYNDCSVGGGMYILFLLAVAYCGFLFRRKKVLTA